MPTKGEWERIDLMIRRDVQDAVEMLEEKVDAVAKVLGEKIEGIQNVLNRHSNGPPVLGRLAQLEKATAQLEVSGRGWAMMAEELKRKSDELKQNSDILNTKLGFLTTKLDGVEQRVIELKPPPRRMLLNWLSVRQAFVGIAGTLALVGTFFGGKAITPEHATVTVEMLQTLERALERMEQQPVQIIEKQVPAEEHKSAPRPVRKSGKKPTEKSEIWRATKATTETELAKLRHEVHSGPYANSTTIRYESFPWEQDK
jgi:hypothetical protein